MNKIRVLLKSQKKLIVIFLLTIVFPCMALSIFGILAIKNEKYQLEQKIFDNQQHALTLLKKQFSIQLKNAEEILQNAAQLTSLDDENYKITRQKLNIILAENKSVDQVFLILDNGQYFFPSLQRTPKQSEYLEPSLNSTQQNMLNRAQKLEFSLGDFRSAIPLYQELFNSISEYNFKALMLNNLARAKKKLGEITSAINNYTRIIERYPVSVTSSRLPLAVTAEFQIIDIYQSLGNKKQIILRGLDLFDRILKGEMNLTKDQFNFYSEMVIKILDPLINKEQVLDNDDNHLKYYYDLKEKYKIQVKKWKDRKTIEDEIIPAMKELKNHAKANPIHFSKRVEGEDFLITLFPISSLLCVKWNNEQMIQEWLQPIISSLLLDNKYTVTITDMLGKALLGISSRKKDQISITSEFDGYFPPWKIHLSSTGTNTEFNIDLFKSYYFWSILTLLMVLIFGTSVIIRVISKEQEIMSIKSDFIASVSHELKTPLTSIKALTERLLSGKVKDHGKMHEYFTVIDQNANKLTHLVKNILDFSKIEEGKKEYQFAKTEIASWLNDTIDEFCKDHTLEPIYIAKNFDVEIPSISIDRDSLSLCLNNLLDNAIKFSRDDKRVEVNLKKNSEYVIISVKDFGIGIEKENISRIFDKFFQGHPTTGHSVKGTGLGLAIVKHALEAHNGRIEVDSVQGQGSTFTLSIPIGNNKL